MILSTAPSLLIILSLIVTPKTVYTSFIYFFIVILYPLAFTTQKIAAGILKYFFIQFIGLLYI